MRLVNSESSPQLRIYPENTPSPPVVDVATELGPLEQAFHAATGYRLKLATADGDARATLSLDASIQRGEAKLDQPQAEQLASEVGQLLGKLHDARRAVADREAELAAGVPLLLHRDDVASLAVRLAAVLKAGAEVLGASRIAMYVLNESTTELKLRSQWGFAEDKLLESARPLAGAVADLEALTGSAVALEDNLLNDVWKVPEPCGAAICVPISSPTSILGTLWLYFDEAKAISDIDTNSAELTAGRLAAELEREMLWRESVDAAPLIRQAKAVREQLQAVRQDEPSFNPWRLAFNAPQDDAGNSASALHPDWLTLPDGSNLLMLVDAGGTSLSQAMQAQLLAATLRSHAEHVTDLALLMQHASRTIWQLNREQQTLGCTLLRLAADGGSFGCCHAGAMSTLIVSPNACEPADREPADRKPENCEPENCESRHPEHPWHSLRQAAPPVGQFEEVDYIAQQYEMAQRHELQPGQLLVLASRRMFLPNDAASPLAGEATLVKTIASLGTCDPQEVAAEINRLALPPHEAACTADACGLLVLGRA